MKNKAIIKLENKRICINNCDITKILKELKELGYNYIIKANDKFLSDWGLATDKTHIQLIACKTIEEKDTILHDLYNDKFFSYINWYYIDDIKQIKAIARNKSYTIRNDWTRCF